MDISSKLSASILFLHFLTTLQACGCSCYIYCLGTQFTYTYEYVYIHWYTKALLMCHLLFYPLSIYIKWSLLTISFFFCFIWYLSTGCQHRLYPFPDEGLLCALMCVHLNLLCSNKDVLYKICFQRRGNFCIFGKIYGDLCVLDCIVGIVPFLFFFSKCAVLGDSVAVLEKSRGGVCSTLLNQEDIQELCGR